MPHPAPAISPAFDLASTWDIFCRVIDNYGDIGVCWRLCRALAASGQRVRLMVDDASALPWLAAPQERQRITVCDWDTLAAQPACELTVARHVIEAFGCQLPANYLQAIATQAPLIPAFCWINLEYLSAEPYAQRNHCLPSPTLSGVAQGFVKTFFYPGFSAGTGGLIREPDLLSQRATFDKAVWLQAQGIPWRGERIITLFCYEPHGLKQLLRELQNDTQPTLLLVTAGRATCAIKAALRHYPQTQYQQGLEACTAPQSPPTKACGQLTICNLPYLTQPDFDRLLWSGDLNFVRGEDSLVRAIWAGKPFVWNIYPQDDEAHHQKLLAFLKCYLTEITPELAQHIQSVHARWNGLHLAPKAEVAQRPIVCQLPEWQRWSAAQTNRWLDLPNLVEELLKFSHAGQAQ